MWLIHTFVSQKTVVDVVRQPSWPPRKIEVMYEIQYNESCITKSPPRPLKITTTYGTNGQKIMEIAANHNSRYQFTATFGSHGFGYFIDIIDGVADNRKTKCYWLLYVGTKFGVSFSAVGITGWIPFPNSKIVWRYTKPDRYI